MTYKIAKLEGIISESKYADEGLLKTRINDRCVRNGNIYRIIADFDIDKSKDALFYYSYDGEFHYIEIFTKIGLRFDNKKVFDVISEFVGNIEKPIVSKMKLNKYGFAYSGHPNVFEFKYEENNSFNGCGHSLDGYGTLASITPDYDIIVSYEGKRIGLKTSKIIKELIDGRKINDVINGIRPEKSKTNKPEDFWKPSRNKSYRVYMDTNGIKIEINGELIDIPTSKLIESWISGMATTFTPERKLFYIDLSKSKNALEEIQKHINIFTGE